MTLKKEVLFLDFRNLDHLFQITDPVLFIESCYQELLGRNINPFDLKNLVLLFHQGMNRHALISVSYTHLSVKHSHLLHPSDTMGNARSV